MFVCLFLKIMVKAQRIWGIPMQPLFRNWSGKKIMNISYFPFMNFFLPWRINMWESWVLTYKRPGAFWNNYQHDKIRLWKQPSYTNWQLIKSIHFRMCSDSKGSRSSEWPSEKGQSGSLQKRFIKTKPDSGFVWKMLNTLCAGKLRDSLTADSLQETTQ